MIVLLLEFDRYEPRHSTTFQIKIPDDCDPDSVERGIEIVLPGIGCVRRGVVCKMSSPRTRMPEHPCCPNSTQNPGSRSTKNVAAQMSGLRPRSHYPNAKPTRTDFLERLTVKDVLE